MRAARLRTEVVEMTQTARLGSLVAMLGTLVVASPDASADGVSTSMNASERPLHHDTVASSLLRGRAALFRFEIASEASRSLDVTGLKHDRGEVILERGTVETAGGTVRLLVGPSRAYVGFELGYAAVTSAPAFRSGSAPGPTPGTLGRTMTPPAGLVSGHGVSFGWPFGFQGAAGPILVGVEAFVGWRHLWIDAPGSLPGVSGAVPMFDLRARAGVWITPTISLAAMVGTGVVVNESKTAGLLVGFSKFPWDGDN